MHLFDYTVYGMAVSHYISDVPFLEPQSRICLFLFVLENPQASSDIPEPTRRSMQEDGRLSSSGYCCFAGSRA